MRLLFLLLVLLALALMLYIRLAPVDAARYHGDPGLTVPGNRPAEGGFASARRITTTPETVLQSVLRIAEGTPRTRLIAGSVAEGIMTFETRSRLMGFPDYTTVTVTDMGGAALLQIHGRLRFGRRDMGVNKARVEDWLARLGPLVAPLS